MTTVNANITRPDLRSSVLSRLTRIKTGFVRACERYSDIKSRRAEIKALEARSDTELARMGLSRDTIAWHVFRDKFYM